MILKWNRNSRQPAPSDPLSLSPHPLPLPPSCFPPLRRENDDFNPPSFCINARIKNYPATWYYGIFFRNGSFLPIYTKSRRNSALPLIYRTKQSTPKIAKRWVWLIMFQTSHLYHTSVHSLARSVSIVASSQFRRDNISRSIYLSISLSFYLSIYLSS